MGRSDRACGLYEANRIEQRLIRLSLHVLGHVRAGEKRYARMVASFVARKLRSACLISLQRDSA